MVAEEKGSISLSNLMKKNGSELSEQWPEQPRQYLSLVAATGNQKLFLRRDQDHKQMLLPEGLWGVKIWPRLCNNIFIFWPFIFHVGEAHLVLELAANMEQVRRRKLKEWIYLWLIRFMMISAHTFPAGKPLQTFPSGKSLQTFPSGKPCRPSFLRLKATQLWQSPWHTPSAESSQSHPFRSHVTSDSSILQCYSLSLTVSNSSSISSFTSFSASKIKKNYEDFFSKKHSAILS